MTGSTIEWSSGPHSWSVLVQDGRYEIALPEGAYRVTIAGPSHVTHVTQRELVAAGNLDHPFTVLTWGSGRFGAVYDAGFHQFFEQIARGKTSSVSKWVTPPSELYVVEGTVPPEQFDLVLGALGELNAESVAAMWCGVAGALQITTGTCRDCVADGRIIVEPNWAEGAGGTLPPPTGARSGYVRVNVFGPLSQRPFSMAEIKGILLHELFHVAFAYHICGGDLGANRWGWSRTNCPYLHSAMTNMFSGVGSLSPEDRLAACLVYHPDTHIGNTYPDINPTGR